MDNEQERYGFLKTIEKYATQFLKVSGHSCMQRVICETAETPFHMDGLLGEVRKTESHVIFMYFILKYD